jgi:hypothetical protein
MRAGSVLAVASSLLMACQLISGLDNLETPDAQMRDQSVTQATTTPCDASADAANCEPMRQCGCPPGASCPANPDSASAPCDPVHQCGCPASQQCQVSDDDLPVCMTPGSTPLLARCSAGSECAAGGGCVAGLCAKYCDEDSDCMQGSCRAIKPGSSVKACLSRCNFESHAPCSAGSQCARLYSGADPSLVDGDYCVIPSSTCATDQRCEEPEWGTRSCTSGSDAADCACTHFVPDASCDLVNRCGCAPATHCALKSVAGTQAILSCVPDRAMPRAPGAICDDETECAAGYSCWRGLCEKYCMADGDCDGGQCIAINSPVEVAGVRLCTVPCDFASERECAQGSRCVHAAGGHDYCFIPRSPCPLTGNGSCDEPSGTRICAAGTDSVDCM